MEQKKQEVTREQLVEQIKLCRSKLVFAGPVHYRDLKKHIRRMEKDLMIYDRFQAKARREHLRN